MSKDEKKLTWRKHIVRVEGKNLILGDVAFDVRLLVIIFYGVLGPMIYWYHQTWQSLAPPLAKMFPYLLGRDAVEMAHVQFYLFFVAPIAICVLGFRESPIKHYGFAIGNWREGLLWTLGGTVPIIVVIAIAMYLDKGIAPIYLQVYYRQAGAEIDLADHLRMIYAASVQLFAWEYLLRGFILFGTARFIGAGPAILLQMIPFALLHLSKTESEAISTIFTGILLGIIAWRTKTFLYVFLIHVIILVTACLIAAA